MASVSSQGVTCRLKLFGGAALECTDPPACARAASPRQLALLALLATRPDGLCRDRLAGLLWPDTPESRARHQLSDSIYFVRCAFGHDALHVAGPCLRLEPELVASDVRAFEDAVRDDRLRAAADVFAGPFLDGFHAGCGRAFEEWQDGARSRYATTMSTVLVRLAGEEETAGNLTEAMGWWDRLELHEPYSSRAAEGVMRLLVRCGDQAQALRRYEIHAARLREHLEVPPAPRLRAVADRIRLGQGRASMLVPGLCHLACEMSAEILEVLLNC